MGFDLAAFTRAISGGLTQKKENERRIEQDRLRAESQALADTMRRTSIRATQEAGRRQRAKDLEVAAQKAKDLEEENERRLEQAARAKQLRGQIDPDVLAGIGDTSGLSTADQITAFQDALERQREVEKDTREHGQAVDLRRTPTGNARTPQDPVAARNDRIRKAATAIMEEEGGEFEEALFKAAQREEAFEEFTALGLTTDQIIAVDEAARDILDGKLSFGALQAQVPSNVLQAVQTRFKQLQAEQQ